MQTAGMPYRRPSRSASSSMAYLEMAYGVPGLTTSSPISSSMRGDPQVGQRWSHAPRRSCSIDRGGGVWIAEVGKPPVGGPADPSAGYRCAASCSAMVGGCARPAQAGQTYRPSPQTDCDDANT